MKRYNLGNYLDLIILIELSRQDSYAYLIIKKLRETMAKEYVVKDASVYNLLKRFEKNNLLEGRSKEVKNNRTRYVYSITNDGLLYLKELKKEWEITKRVIDNTIREGAINA